MRARHRSERGALPRTSGAFDGNGDQPLAKDRLRSRGGDCQGKRENWTNRSRDCAGEKDLARRGTRARPGSDQNDRAGRNWRELMKWWSLENFESAVALYTIQQFNVLTV